MCLICVDYNKGLLTLEEALDNLHETINYDEQSTDHYWEVIDLLFEDHLD